MVVMTSTRPARPMTRADLDALPDDGYRHELVDGVLIVSPSPSRLHQRAVGELYAAFRGGRPRGIEVLVAPFDVALSDDTIVEPDIVVARVADFTDRDLPVPPLLAVEVLSPSTRRYDLLLKRSRYEAAGIGSYWVVDPDEPSLTAWDLVDGGYVEVGHVSGDESWTAVHPFAVTVTPAALVSPPA